MAELDTLDRPLQDVDSWTLGEIIDADAHIDPPHHMWQEYLPAHLKDRGPRIEEGDDCDWVVFEGNRRPLQMINNQAGRDGKNFKMRGKLSDMRAAWDANFRLTEMDLDGMSQAVLFGGGPLGTLDNELYMASYEAYQNWVMDWCSADSNRLHPVGYLPMRDIDETIGQIQRLAKMGFKAINLPAFPQNAKAWETSSNVANMKAGQVSALTGDPKGELQYYQPEFDRMWAVIQDLDLTVTMHLGGRVPRFGDKLHFLPDMPMSKLAMAEPVSMFIFHGIFQRFPGLRLGMIESGVGWMAWFTEYVTRTWEKQRYWVESPLTESPAFYMDRNVWGSFIQDRTGVLCRNLPGGRNIMWSSDYPHSETTYPNSRKIIMRDFDGVPAEETKAIICTNAKRFFRLG
ncbi:MAG: amidohydrolase family protein [Novosphingobium sp.]